MIIAWICASFAGGLALYGLMVCRELREQKERDCLRWEELYKQLEKDLYGKNDKL